MLDSYQNNHLIQALSNLPGRIEECIAALSDTLLGWQPDEDSWSIQMVLAHLLHCEPLFQERLQHIFDHDNPTLAGFGPEQATPISEQSSAALLDDFVAARKQTLTQIYAYSPDDWERPAVHRVQGKTTLKGQIQNIVKHDMEHLGQIYDLRELWQSQNNHEKEIQE